MRTYGVMVLTAVILVAADAPPESPSAKKGAEDLQGKWVLVATEYKGNPLEGLKEKHVWVFEGDKVTVLKDGKKEREFKFTTNGSKQPAHIDFMRLDGDSKGEKAKCVYSLTGDELKICMSHTASEGRPVDIKTGPKSELLVLQFKREPK